MFELIFCAVIPFICGWIIGYLMSTSSTKRVKYNVDPQIKEIYKEIKLIQKGLRIRGRM